MTEDTSLGIAPDKVCPTVFSKTRRKFAPRLVLPEGKGLVLDKPLKMDGLEMLSLLEATTIPVVFFDPQYRGLLDQLRYGNEGKNRGKKRAQLNQMDEERIARFVEKIDHVLMPSGHLFLWIDKFHLCQGFQAWLHGTALHIVDMVTWNKGRMGMGYRTRRQAEYLVVVQKSPRRAKGVWRVHDIPDVVAEVIADRRHTHQKPHGLQERLIRAVSNEGDVIVDPAAGSFSVMDAAHAARRHFLGCDINLDD